MDPALPIFSSMTHGIIVSAQPKFEETVFENGQDLHVFSYNITIQNKSTLTVRLLSRKWEIAFGDGSKKIVEGDGVVGQQPTLKPDESFTYSSWCPIHTDLGTMHGQFRFEIYPSLQTIWVDIPKFSLQTNFILN